MAAATPPSYRPFLSQLDGKYQDFPVLPLMHTTTVVKLLKIFFEGHLNLEECPVFKRPLVYFFYGRTAYRLDPLERQTSQAAAAPVVLIFRPESVPIRSVYPFDTGGYPHGSQALAQGRVEMGDFAMSTVKDADKTVQHFWKSRKSYFWFQTNDLVQPSSFPQGNIYAQLYHGLLALDSSADDRRGTVEISCEKSVEVSSASLLGLVIPHDLMERNEVKSLEDTVKVRSYPYFGGRGVEYFSEIRTLVGSILEELRLL
jgi:hypothetical protein